MSLILATGSNLGNSQEALSKAREILQKHFKLIEASQIYSSAAVDYENQPDFLNQVLEFELPSQSPQEVVQLLLDLEKSMGRERKFDKGPRTIDIDLIFYGLERVSSDIVTVPHPRLFERSFVVKPLSELPFFATLKKHFKFSFNFSVDAQPI